MQRKKIFWAILALSAWCSFFAAGVPAQLIEPTRSIDGAFEEKGLLNILSEPPGLEVHIDGRLMGETPIFSLRLPTGAHVLRIQDNEIDLCLTGGKTHAISWFKGRFIAIPEKVKPAHELAQEPQAPRPKSKSDESSGHRQGAEKGPYYWPLNPRGPIY